MTEATIFDAKTKLSQLVKKAQQGERVVITSGRKREPVAMIIPYAPVKKKSRLGFMEKPGFEIPASFWEPLSDEECGLADDDLLKL